MLKLKTFVEATWFDYPKAPDVRFKIRFVPLSYQLELRSKLRKRIPIEVEVGKPLQFIEDVDEGAFLWVIFDKILEAWEGIEVDGSPTEEDIKKAIFDSEDLRTFIVEKSKELSQAVEEKLEKERKNLSSSQSG